MRNPIQLTALAISAFLLGTAAAPAQTVGTDEAIKPNGTVVQNLALTPAQKNAIHNAVFQQRVRPFTVRLTAAVGAPVPPAVELLDLPDQATADNPWAALLKYAMVENDVVVVDPVGMRVVDVIHDGAKP
jgi:hypothetical protein